MMGQEHTPHFNSNMLLSSKFWKLRFPLNLQKHKEKKENDTKKLKKELKKLRASQQASDLISWQDIHHFSFYCELMNCTPNFDLDLLLRLRSDGIIIMGPNNRCRILNFLVLN